MGVEVELLRRRVFDIAKLQKNWEALAAAPQFGRRSLAPFAVSRETSAGAAPPRAVRKTDRWATDRAGARSLSEMRHPFFGSRYPSGEPRHVLTVIYVTPQAFERRA